MTLENGYIIHEGTRVFSLLLEKGKVGIERRCVGHEIEESNLLISKVIRSSRLSKYTQSERKYYVCSREALPEA